MITVFCTTMRHKMTFLQALNCCCIAVKFLAIKLSDRWWFLFSHFFYQLPKKIRLAFSTSFNFILSSSGAWESWVWTGELIHETRKTSMLSSDESFQLIYFVTSAVKWMKFDCINCRLMISFQRLCLFSLSWKWNWIVAKFYLRSFFKVNWVRN